MAEPGNASAPDPWAAALPQGYEEGSPWWEDFGYTSVPEWAEDEYDIDPDTYDA